MKQIKVSIIVPIYNSSRYLHKCVQSCLNQTLKEIEIILVDDASTDNSYNLIEKYAKQYSQKVISICLKKNLHQGGARNRGIEIAKGEYLCFVDSDDWIEPDMCELLYRAAKSKNADMAGGNYFISTDSGEVVQYLKYQTCDLKKERREGLHKYYLGQGYFWNRIYSRKFILENQIFFPERVFYEDAYFNFLTGIYANYIVKIEKAFYHYYQSPNSTIRVKNQSRLYDRIIVVRKLAENCIKRGLFYEYGDEIRDKVLNMSASSILYSCLNGFDQPNVEKLKEIRRDVRQYCPNYKRQKAYKEMNISLKWYLNQTMWNPVFAVWSYKHGANLFLGILESLYYNLEKYRKKKIK